MSHPSMAALDLRIDLARRWRRDEGRAAITSDDDESDRLDDIDRELRRMLGGDDDGSTDLDSLGKILVRLLTGAETYWVNRDMSVLTAAAMRSMPPQGLRRDDLPTRTGFVMFAAPLPLDAETSVVAFLWREVSDGVEVWEWHPDDIAIVFCMKRWRWGDRWLDDEADAALPSVEEQASTRRALSSFWALSQQRIARRSSIRPDRAVVRRAGRADVEPKDVKLVTLRAYSEGRQDAEPTSDMVEWSHRWMVSGHWRNQYLPSLSTHRYQWIGAYVKGPADKPLVVKPKIAQLVR